MPVIGFGGASFNPPDNSRLVLILADALLKHGVSQIEVSQSAMKDLFFHDVTVKVVEDYDKDCYTIHLRNRKHDDQYVEYEIIQDPPSRRLSDGSS